MKACEQHLKSEMRGATRPQTNMGRVELLALALSLSLSQEYG